MAHHNETMGERPVSEGALGRTTNLHSAPMGAHMQRCIDDCTECHAICLSTVRYCLTMGGEHAEAGHIGLMLDCADICATSADFMLRNSPMHGLTCGVCADVCLACAESCEQFAGDAQMEMCAEVCRRCADSCREMANMVM